MCRFSSSGSTIDGRWSELRGDRFSEVRNTLYRRVASFPGSLSGIKVRGRRREPGDYCILPARPDPKDFVGSG